MKRNAISCISGGVDSVTAAYYVNKVIKPPKQLLLFFNYGQRTYEYEEFCVAKISNSLRTPLKILDLQWLGEISTSVLTHPEMPIPETKIEDLWDPENAEQRILRWWDPSRNALFLIAALAHAESFHISKGDRYDVCIGIRRESPVPMRDNTKEFLEEMNRLVEHATYHGGYRILAPLIEHDKDRVVKLGEELGVPWQWTYSCYAGTRWTTFRGERLPVHCGACSNDKRRHIAFVQAGVPDPSIYVKYPQFSEGDVGTKFGNYYISQKYLKVKK